MCEVSGCGVSVRVSRDIGGSMNRCVWVCESEVSVSVKCESVS